MEKSTLNKMQHQFWVTKQTVYRKLGKKEDECIVASDAELDAKLELFKSIQQTSSAMNKLLDRYQERICYLAQEQNAMGRFLKEYGKADKSGAGKMMIQMGKSLIYCSQQEIALRPPLLRLYQEVETFRNRAVEDTLDTIHHMERLRTEYRASLNWMKNVSQELDPDTCKQMEKFRKVQTHVKMSKGQFDKLKLACLQKVDLLAAARCNMFSHALIQYQNATMKTTGKNARIYNTLATTFKGYQHFEFSVVKELAEPSKRLAKECGTQEPTEDLLFDFADELGGGGGCGGGGDGGDDDSSDSNLDGSTSEEAKLERAQAKAEKERRKKEADLLASASASELLENLLGPIDESAEAETGQDTLDLGLGLFSSGAGSGGSGDGKDKGSTGSLISIGSFKSKSKDHKKEKVDKDSSKDVMDLLTADELDSIPFENDTMALLNEILSASTPALCTQQPLIPINETGPGSTQPTASMSNPLIPSNQPNNSFLPSHLLDFANLDNSTADLLNFTSPPLNQPLHFKKEEQPTPNKEKSWFDIFADIDPLANPDSIGPKAEETKESENRYC